MRRRSLIAAPLAGLAATVGLAPVALAQAWPNRPVRIVVPYPAGQGSDLFARRFAEHFQQRVGRPFVVENRPGAGGNIGTAAVARAEPDGHTLLWGTNATHAANEFLFASLGFDPVRDFEPVAGVLRLGMVLAAARDSEIRSLADLLALARSRPGQVSVGVPSTTARAVLAMLRQAAGVELTPVPYTGSGQALTGLLRGDVQASLDTVTASLGPIRGGQVAPLAVSLGRRSESLPETPTFREAGIDLEADAWNALYAPRGTPAEVVRALNAAANTALADPALRAAVVRDGAEPMGGTPEDLATMMRRDRAKWGPAIRSLGLAPQ
jgi:tripartite-type tricarboxylate transporter receptor subunit TctC